MSELEIILSTGIPSAVMGLAVWLLKRHIDKRDAKIDERTKNIEKLMLMIMQDGRANNVLAVATAKAVQRIPDAHCNGDMMEALRRADIIQKEEKEFLMKQGVKHIFED